MTSKKELLERIETLEEQVIEKKNDYSVLTELYSFYYDIVFEKATLIEKVNAIIEYLDINVYVKSESKKVVATPMIRSKKATKKTSKKDNFMTATELAASKKGKK
jgi:hypothetical protein